MIGDNPAGDILGANREGWVSILVRSGIYAPEGRHKLSAEMTPTHEVDDMEAALKLIANHENLKL